MDLPIPSTMTQLQRLMISLFAFYARWIPHYSGRIWLLIETTTFPLSDEAIKSLEAVRKIIAEATLKVIDESLLFSMETDASDIAVSAVLQQCG